MINQSLLVAEKPLKVRVISIKESMAKLGFSDKQNFQISKKYLPEGAKVGDELYFNLLSEEELSLNKEEIAKKLLENILSQDES
jgi:hypothetical protein